MGGNKVIEGGGKVEEILLWSWIALIPLQLGKHWWFRFTLLQGVRVDWLSPTLYLLDLFWLAWFFVCLVQKFYLPSFLQTLACWKEKKKNGFLVKFLLLAGIVFLNIYFSQRWQVAVYWWLRVGQLGISWWFLQDKRKQVGRILIKTIPFWIVLETGLALAQVLKGGGIQGPFYWLGERAFSVLSLGVAKWSIGGGETVRAYGTFSHPNSLAGFLGIIFLPFRLLKNGEKGKEKKLYWLGNLFLLLGVFLTGSRSVWVALLVTQVFFSFKNLLSRQGLKKMGGLLLVGTVFLFLWGRGSYLTGWDGESMDKRVELLVRAGRYFLDSPIWGVGLGNFVVKLSNQGWGRIGWQPVHNIFWLWVVETGVLGLLMFWLVAKGFLCRSMKRLRITKTKQLKIEISSKWQLLFFVFLTGMVDHYWLTLPQNRWILLFAILLF